MYKITFDASYACVSRVRVSVWLETNTGLRIPDLVLREVLDSAINEVELFMAQTAIRFSLDNRICHPFHELLQPSYAAETSLFSLEVSVSEGKCSILPVIRTKEQRQFHVLLKISGSQKFYSSFSRRLQLELLQTGLNFSQMGTSKVTELEV